MATIIYKNFRTYRKKREYFFTIILKQQPSRNFFLTIAVNSMSMSGRKGWTWEHYLVTTRAVKPLWLIGRW